MEGNDNGAVLMEAVLSKTEGESDGVLSKLKQSMSSLYQSVTASHATSETPDSIWRKVKVSLTEMCKLLGGLASSSLNIILWVGPVTTSFIKSISETIKHFYENLKSRGGSPIAGVKDLFIPFIRKLRKIAITHLFQTQFEQVMINYTTTGDKAFNALKLMLDTDNTQKLRIGSIANENIDGFFKKITSDFHKLNKQQCCTNLWQVYYLCRRDKKYSANLEFIKNFLSRSIELADKLADKKPASDDDDELKEFYDTKEYAEDVDVNNDVDNDDTQQNKDAQDNEDVKDDNDMNLLIGFALKEHKTQQARKLEFLKSIKKSLDDASDSSNKQTVEIIEKKINDVIIHHKFATPEETFDDILRHQWKENHKQSNYKIWLMLKVFNDSIQLNQDHTVKTEKIQTFVRSIRKKWYGANHERKARTLTNLTGDAVRAITTSFTAVTQSAMNMFRSYITNTHSVEQPSATDEKTEEDVFVMVQKTYALTPPIGDEYDNINAECYAVFLNERLEKKKVEYNAETHLNVKRILFTNRKFTYDNFSKSLSAHPEWYKNIIPQFLEKLNSKEYSSDEDEDFFKRVWLAVTKLELETNFFDNSIHVKLNTYYTKKKTTQESVIRELTANVTQAHEKDVSSAEQRDADAHAEDYDLTDDINLNEATQQMKILIRKAELAARLTRNENLANRKKIIAQIFSTRAPPTIETVIQEICYGTAHKSLRHKKAFLFLQFLFSRYKSPIQADTPTSTSNTSKLYERLVRKFRKAILKSGLVDSAQTSIVVSANEMYQTPAFRSVMAFMNTVRVKARQAASTIAAGSFDVMNTLTRMLGIGDTQTDDNDDAVENLTTLNIKESDVLNLIAITKETIPADDEEEDVPKTVVSLMRRVTKKLFEVMRWDAFKSLKAEKIAQFRQAINGKVDELLVLLQRCFDDDNKNTDDDLLIQFLNARDSNKSSDDVTTLDMLYKADFQEAIKIWNDVRSFLQAHDASAKIIQTLLSIQTSARYSRRRSSSKGRTYELDRIREEEDRNKRFLRIYNDRIRHYAQREGEERNIHHKLTDELKKLIQEIEETGKLPQNKDIILKKDTEHLIELATHRIYYNVKKREMYETRKARVEKYMNYLIDDDKREYDNIQANAMKTDRNEFKMLRYGQCDWADLPCANGNSNLFSQLKYLYFGYAIGELAEGIRYDKFVKHFAGTTFSNGHPVIGSSVRVILKQRRTRSSSHKSAKGVPIAKPVSAIEFFMMKYDTEHDKTISLKRKKHNRYTYCINFREWDKARHPRIGYVGNLTAADILSALPRSLRTERRGIRGFGVKRNKLSQSNKHILEAMLSSFGSTRTFCNKLLRLKQGNDNEFFLRPKDSLPAQFTKRRKSVRQSTRRGGCTMKRT